jgi:TolB protein
MNVDGSEETVLTEDTYNSIHPRFSPDGQWIVYVSDQAGNKDIRVMKVDGSCKTQLTTNPSTDTYPVWGSDVYIYFVSNRGFTWGIWRLKPNLSCF